MKTFKDLIFTEHSISSIEKGAKQAVLAFDNGRSISVGTGAKLFRTSEDRPYEVGFFKKDGSLGVVHILSSTNVLLNENSEYAEVEKCCNEEDVNLIMKHIQNI
tara:strand:- start:2800 stop:3111 length:312 start_codon:yes stop_codon:yes gene_type:complete